MPLLEAFLALALTMLSLATLATAGVELLHRTLRTRGKDLKRMLEMFYETELKEIVDSHFHLAGDAIDEEKNKIITGLMENPLMPKQTSRLGKWLGKWLDEMNDLPTEDMLKRLQKTPAGEALLAKGDIEANLLLDNVTAKYDAYGNVASDFFKRRAKMVSLIMGVVVALVLNVDALFLFTTYLQDPETRFAVTSNAESITQNWESVEQGVKRAAALNDATAPAAKEGDPPATKDASTTESQENLNAIKSELAEIKKLATDLQGDISTPLGYGTTMAPATYICALTGMFCPDEKVKVKKTDDAEPWRNAGYLLLWLVRVIGSGLLIGLGGPFWFSVVQKLMSATGRVSAAGATGSTQGASASAFRDPGSTKHSAFFVGARADKVMATSGERDEDGEGDGDG